MFLDPENRMFVGTFDDSVSRYPWADMRADVSYLNRVLIFHALLGTRLCSRIGSILYHEPYRIALMDETVSPLRELTRAGFMQLQMIGQPSMRASPTACGPAPTARSPSSSSINGGSAPRCIAGWRR